MKKKYAGMVLASAALLALPLFITSGYGIQSLIMVLLFAYWSSCWNIIGGYGGQLSMGHSTYAGVGAYTTAILFTDFGISPWISMLAGALAAGLLSVLISYPCFKLRGSYFTLSTVALANVIRIAVLQEDSIFGLRTNGAMGVKIPWRGGSFWDLQFMGKRSYYYIALAMLFFAVFISWKIKGSRTGYYLAAINTNQDAAASLGVDVTRCKLKAMFISAALTAVGGSFYAVLIQFVDPERLLGYALSVEIMTFAVVGGRGTLIGPLLGAFIMVPVSELTRTYLGTSLSGISGVLYGLILMLVVFFIPGGLSSVLSRIVGGKSPLPGQGHPQKEAA